MRFKTLAFVTASLTTTACGGIESSPGEVEPWTIEEIPTIDTSEPRQDDPGPEIRDPEVATPEVPRQESCNPGLIRETQNFSYHLGQRDVAFSANGEMVHTLPGQWGQLHSLRASDGTAFVVPVQAPLDFEPRSGRIAAMLDADGESSLVVYEPGGTELIRLQSEPYREQITARISPGGDRLAVARCTADDGASLEWYDLDSARELGRIDTVEEGVECPLYSEHHTIIDFRGDELVVAFTWEGTLQVVDMNDGTVRQRLLAHDYLPDAEAGDLYRPRILDLAIHPHGGTLATSGIDGRVRFWNADTLEPVGEPLATSHATINLYTYMPHRTVSPVEWSPGGDTFAFTNPDGEVELRGALEGKLSAGDPGPEMLGDVNAPVSLAFHPEGGVAVSYNYSVGLYGCNAPTSAPPQVLAPLTLRADRTSVRTYDAITVSIVGLSDPTVPRRLFVDGEEVWAHWQGDQATVSFAEPGSRTLRVETTDGEVSQEGTIDVVVLPRAEGQ